MDSNHTCSEVISLDSALNKDGNYYPQVFLKECKHIKNKVIRHIIDNLESSSNDSDDFDWWFWWRTDESYELNVSWKCSFWKSDFF